MWSNSRLLIPQLLTSQLLTQLAKVELTISELAREVELNVLEVLLRH